MTLIDAWQVVRSPNDSLPALRPLTSLSPPVVHAEVVRSADLISYTAEEGLRYFGEASWFNYSSNQLVAGSPVPPGRQLLFLRKRVPRL